MDINKYNTSVRHAISDKYVEYSKTKAMMIRERGNIIERLRVETKTLSYEDYISLQEKADRLSKEIEKLNVQIDIWDKAREICLNIAEEQ
jgi:hypothetical protein